MTNTVATLSGFFKEVYADKVEDLIPDGVQAYKDIPFVQKSQQNGNQFHQPVVLTGEHGFTYAAASAGAFAINSAVGATHKDAAITGSQLLLETRLDYEAAARGSGGVKAFGQVTKHIVENMMRSFYKRLEIELFYGGTGTIYSGLCRLGTRVSGSGTTTQVYNVSAGHWAPGIWAGAEGALVDGYDDDGSGGVASTKINTNADITVSAVDFTNKRLTLVGNATDLDALTSAPSATDPGAYLYWKGAKGNEFAGLVQIVSNTGSLFGIDAATYSLWQGNSFSASSAQLTFAKLLKAFDGPVGRGLSERVCVYLNPTTWTNVMSDLAALRKFDQSYKPMKGENGFEGVEFYGQFGAMELKPSIYVKEGLAFGVAKARLKRLGATDMTFRVPGMEEEQFLYQLPSNAGYAIRAYANQALFSSHPAFNVLITGITNS